jgi:hypothetical protein
MAPSRRIVLALLLLTLGAICTVNRQFALQAVGEEQTKAAPSKEAGEKCPWGGAVDGIACRLVVQPRYVIGQAISAVVEVKNTSDKKRYLAPVLDPRSTKHLTVEISGPNGKVRQTNVDQGLSWLGETHFQPIEPGEVKRFEVADLRGYFGDLDDLQTYPERKANAVPTGKYEVQFRFRSPPVPARFIVAQSFDKGKEVFTYKDVPKEVTASQWAKEAMSVKVAFELAPLDKDDLVVHEWGVFTVFNDVKYANVNRKEEWGSLPSFFYRQFPKERLRWVPSAWDKPIVYFYAKNTPMHVNVKVTFADGAPVVWWPAVASPVEDRPYETGPDPRKTKPFRSLVWDAWIGDKVPPAHGQGALVKVEDFPLPADCWLQQARLPGASRLTVVGNIEGPGKVRFPGAKDRSETERFLYYDGLVPSSDYIRCEKIDAKSVTMRNRAKFDIARLFVVDRRVKEKIGFAFVDGTKQPFKAGTALKIDLRSLDPEDWPFTGMKQVRQALLDTGLFEAEADSLLKIWEKRLFQAEDVTAFHILPAAEYDRMLPIDILPAPAAKPLRVGIALHPHVEIEPALTEQIGTLIRQLDSPHFDKRVAADKTLREVGPLAIGLLQAELKKGVPIETRRRIQAILERADAPSWLQFPVPVKKPEK